MLRRFWPKKKQNSASAGMRVVVWNVKIRVCCATEIISKMRIQGCGCPGNMDSCAIGDYLLDRQSTFIDEVGYEVEKKGID